MPQFKIYTDGYFDYMQTNLRDKLQDYQIKYDDAIEDLTAVMQRFTAAIRKQYDDLARENVNLQNKIQDETEI